MGLEGGENRELLNKVYKIVDMQSFASWCLCCERGEVKGGGKEKHMFLEHCDRFSALLLPFQLGGRFAKVPHMNVKDRMSQNTSQI